MYPGAAVGRSLQSFTNSPDCHSGNETHIVPAKKDVHRESFMSISTILLILLVLLLVGALPAWPYSTGWGYYPSGGLGLVLIVLLVLVVTGRL
jgi:hypothetical protein